VAVAVVLASLVASGCASDGDGAADKAARTIVIGSRPQPESVMVANMYAGALQNEGYQVTVRKRLGQLEILLPALQKGGGDNGIDLSPEYVGTLLEFVNKNAGEANGNLDASVATLRTRLDAIGLSALDPSPATNQQAFAVTRKTAERLRAAKLSDLVPVAGELTLGAPPDCPARPSCAPGLETTYGLKFKAVRPLDSCETGARTLDALSVEEIDVGLVCSTDGGVAVRNLVVLEDDKKLQTVGNIIPALRKDIVDKDIKKVLNKVSRELKTVDLVELNRRVIVEKADPEALAAEWLQGHGFTKKK